MEEKEKKYHIEGQYPPGIVNLPDKHYIVSGSQRIDCEEDTELSDVIWDQAPEEPEEDDSGSGSWRVPSSRDLSKFYTVTQFEGQWSCNCPGWNFKSTCSHVDDTILEMTTIYYDSESHFTENGKRVLVNKFKKLLKPVLKKYKIRKYNLSFKEATENFIVFEASIKVKKTFEEEDISNMYLDTKIDLFSFQGKEIEIEFNTNYTELIEEEESKISN